VFQDNGNGQSHDDDEEQTSNGEGGVTVEAAAPLDPPRPVEPVRPGLDDEHATQLTEELVNPPREELLGTSIPEIEVPSLPPPNVGLRLMPRLDTLDNERWWKRALYLVLMLGLLAGYFYMLMSYWAPAHSGINQNGYLVGGKFLAEHGTMGYKPREPYAYLGWMWNLVEVKNGNATDIWYYPKYPIGTSAAFAACLKASQWIKGNWEAGKIWTFYVNPVTMTLSLAAMFLMLRLVCGSFIALLGTMILGCSQVVLSYANQPLSHGPAMFAVTWGMYFLLTWWVTGSIWRGICAGLLLGYAVTTRYTEGLLAIPIGAAALAMISYDRSSIRWWSLSAWLVACAIGLWVAHGTHLPVDRWYTLAATGIVAIGIGMAPILRGEFRWAGDVGDSAQPQGPGELVASDVLNYRVPTRRRAWITHVMHWVRLVIVAGLVLALVRMPPIKIEGADDGADLIVTIVLKLGIGIAVAMMYLMPWSQPRRYLGVLVPTLAWLVPVAFLLAYNKLAMHSTTGYDTTNESTAFTWRTFLDKWDDTVQQLYDYSMFLIPPLAVAGIVLMYRWSWRVAMFATLWLLPPLLVYIAYYFGKQRPGMWYLRFFLTLFPPMLLAAMWLLRAATDGIRDRAGVGRGRGSVAVPLGLGIFTASSCAVGLWLSLPSMEREFYTNYNLAFTAQRINKKIPLVEINGKRALPVLFAEGQANPNGPLCNMIQFSADAELYPSDGFRARGMGWRGEVDNNAPNPLQAKRQDYLIKLFRAKTEPDLVREQNRIMRQALDEGRPVYAVLQPATVNGFKRYITADFEMKLIDQWREPMRVPIERSMGPLDSSSRGMPFYPTRPAQTWQMFEVTLKPKPTPKPQTTQPATQPTTVPSRTMLALPTTAPTTAPSRTLLALPTTAPTTAGPSTGPTTQATGNSSRPGA
jgi:hypothetical protein